MRNRFREFTVNCFLFMVLCIGVFCFLSLIQCYLFNDYDILNLDTFSRVILITLSLSISLLIASLSNDNEKSWK